MKYWAEDPNSDKEPYLWCQSCSTYYGTEHLQIGQLARCPVCGTASVYMETFQACLEMTLL